MIKLDAVDLAILEELQRDARQKNKELARRIGLSASACLERVRRLERTGVIVCYRAILDVRTLGARYDAWIHVTLISGTSIDTFLGYLRRAPEIASAYHLSGPEEFLLHVVTRSIETWRAFQMRAEADGFAFSTAHVSVVIDCIKPPCFGPL
jgi:DNA-binding Lrp family transcriptional regulator